MYEPKGKNDSLDIVESVLHVGGVQHPVRVRGGVLQYRDLPLYAVAQKQIEWFSAPEWAQNYYDQVRQELSGEQCKKCGSDIRMIVMTGSGFCSMNCQDEYDSPEASNELTKAS